MWQEQQGMGLTAGINMLADPTFRLRSVRERRMGVQAAAKEEGELGVSTFLCS